jgi:hypothetical protein
MIAFYPLIVFSLLLAAMRLVRFVKTENVGSHQKDVPDAWHSIRFNEASCGPKFIPLVEEHVAYTGLAFRSPKKWVGSWKNVRDLYVLHSVVKIEGRDGDKSSNR